MPPNMVNAKPVCRVFQERQTGVVLDGKMEGRYLAAAETKVSPGIPKPVHIDISHTSSIGKT